jgi:hypothetical protein
VVKLSSTNSNTSRNPERLAWQLRGFAVAVRVNQTMAGTFWPSQVAVGRRLKFGGAGPPGPWSEIVGIAGDVPKWTWLFRLERRGIFLTGKLSAIT